MNFVCAITLLFILAGCSSTPTAATKATTAPTDKTESPAAAAMSHALASLQRGSTKEAITQYLDPLLADFDKTYGHSAQKIYCARSTKETLYYMVLASSTKQGAVALNSEWSDALYLKAYAYIDLGDLENAKIYLNKALVLAPKNARYLSELGHIYQSEKNWSQAKATFTQAVEAAESFSPDPIKKFELVRAKRGISFALVETGHLTEAETILKECLTIDSLDPKTLSELKYVRSLMAGGQK